MHYSTSEDSDDGTVATETVNAVHSLRLNCKTTQRFSGRICLRLQGGSVEPTVTELLETVSYLVEAHQSRFCHLSTPPEDGGE
jgi:hypothetical protein